MRFGNDPLISDDMATIVFIPYPETGHLNASFKMAKSLKTRGHQIYYLALADYEEYIRSQGINFIPIYPELFPKGFVYQEAVNNNRENFEAILLRAKASRTFNPAKEIHNIVRSIQPALFVIDVLLPDLALIINHIGVPAILINTMLHNPWTGMGAAYEPLINLPELILCPQEFDFPDRERRMNSHYVEASIDLERTAGSFPWHKVDAGKPLIYCSLGSQSHLVGAGRSLFQAVIDAIALMPHWQLILSIGPGLAVEEFQPAPANVLIVNTAPQLEILKRASIMISHGGLNSIKESIFFGVPMILFPIIRDQPASAARVVYHGLGVKAKFQKSSVELIRALVAQIDGNPSFKARVDSMAMTFREQERSARGVQIIEALLSESPRVLRN